MTEPSVIFVDDDPHIRQAIAQTLKLEDLPVSCYESAPSALGQIDADYDGVVLCDYNMPEMNGLDFVKALRREETGDHPDRPGGHQYRRNGHAAGGL